MIKGILSWILPKKIHLQRWLETSRKKRGFFTTKGSCFIEFVRPGSDAVLQVSQNEFNELSSCKTRGE